MIWSTVQYNLYWYGSSNDLISVWLVNLSGHSKTFDIVSSMVVGILWCYRILYCAVQYLQKLVCAPLYSKYELEIIECRVHLRWSAHHPSVRWIPVGKNVIRSTSCIQTWQAVWVLFWIYTKICTRKFLFAYSGIMATLGIIIVNGSVFSSLIFVWINNYFKILK